MNNNIIGIGKNDYIAVIIAINKELQTLKQQISLPSEFSLNQKQSQYPSYHHLQTDHVMTIQKRIRSEMANVFCSTM